jgi:D-aminopeptidase
MLLRESLRRDGRIMVKPIGGRRVLALAMAGLLLAARGSCGQERPRLRELGVRIGVLPPGKWNAITDVAGVRVGHRTIVEGESIRTGVTAILPHPGDLFRRKAPAGVWVGNGFGKAAGFLQVRELGNLETPIVLTNTLAVAPAVEALVSWTLSRPGNEEVRSVNALAGETNDGRLNDIRARRVTARDVIAAIESAAAGPVEEGSVGAGTGTVAFGWKGGIGTASRLLPAKLGGWTVGALVQSNFGGILTIDGVRVGELLGRYAFRKELEGLEEEPEGGSCMIVLATDAPLSSRNLERLARRGLLGLARTGSFLDNGSGDFVIAFSTKNLEEHGPRARTRELEEVHNDFMGPLFLAAVESVEEAVINSLTRATTVTGYRGRKVEAIPIDRLRGILARRPTPLPGRPEP